MHKNSSTKVLVLGASGLLGSTLAPILRNDGFEVLAASRSSVNVDINFDPLNYEEVKLALKSIHPDFVINLVGYTSVEECELNKDIATRIHVLPNLNLVAARSQEPSVTAKILSISSDHLYDSPGPSQEHEISIVNHYALTKYQGELALDSTQDLNLRTNFVGKSKNRSRESLTDWVKASAEGQREVSVLRDVLFSPLSMTTLSNLIIKVLKDFQPGTMNLGSTDGFSKAEFDLKFARSMGLGVDKFREINLEEATFLSARRPKDMRMDVSRFEAAFEVNLPTLDDEINRLVREYSNDETN